MLAAIEMCAARFNRLNTRERVLIAVAAVAAIAALWNILLIQPLEVKRKALTAEVGELQSSLLATSQATQAGRAADPIALARQQIKSAEDSLAAVNGKLGSTSAGLLPAQGMAEVLQDVLRQRHDVRLISLRSEPVANLSGQSADGAGPYLHPVELIVEGRYLDILDYLRALEALHWHLYWKTLELDSGQYPLNRVRIELGALSLDQTWLGF